MYGGAGSDVYFVDSLRDMVDETSDAGGFLTTDAGGTDTVVSSIIGTYALPVYTIITSTLGKVENLVLAEVANVTGGTGNDLPNRLIGNSLNNTLTANGGDDYLDGRAGADAMTGGTGNDTYVVDDTGDTITESPITGTGSTIANGTADTVSVTGSILYPLATKAAGIERATVIGFATGGIDATTYATVITLTGNAAGNTLIGGTMNDYLYGQDGDDALIGNNGNDILDGGTNSTSGDTLTGGNGNDTYFVNSTLDKVVENLNVVVANVAGSVTGTIDTLNVAMTVSTDIYSMQATSSGIEIAKITGLGNQGIDASLVTSSISLIGNASQNTLTGGSGSDTIDGGGGIDKLSGGGGIDTYIVDSTSDLVIGVTGGGASLDTVKVNITAAGSTYAVPATVENATIISAAAINLTSSSSTGGTLTGNAAANSITGSGAVDTIIGGGGLDSITPGLGADKVVLDNVATSADTISGFVTASDVIDLSAALAPATLTIGTQVAFDTTAKATTIAAITTAANTDAAVYYLSNTAGHAQVLTLAEIETAITNGALATGETVVLVDNGADTSIYFDLAAQTGTTGTGLILVGTLSAIHGTTALATNDLISV